MRGLFALVAGAVMSSLGHAQPVYPERTVRIIVPSAAGGGVDVQARIAANALAARLKQPFVVENRVGAGGNIGTAFVAQAPADGYTLLLTAPALTINQTLYAKPGFDVKRDFAAVGQWSFSPLVFIAGPQTDARDLKELAARARAEPGKMSYASGGIGFINHLVLEFFRVTAGLDMLHIPFGGQAPALTAIVGGQVAFTVDSIASAAQSVRAGRVRALATTGRERSPELPAVPTVSESGFPELVAYTWYGMFAPAATPTRILDALNAAMLESLADPDTQRRIAAIGATPDPKNRAASTAFIDQELARWKKVVADAKLKAE